MLDLDLVTSESGGILARVYHAERVDTPQSYVATHEFPAGTSYEDIRAVVHADLAANGRTNYKAE